MLLGGEAELHVLGQQVLESAAGAEQRDPAELYDLIDVVRSLIRLEDPSGEISAGHRAKAADMGGFTQFVEWCPVPGATDDGIAG